MVRSRTVMTTTLGRTLASLRDDFLRLHVVKEDLFWAVKMGLRDDADVAQRALSEAEVAMNRFLQDPDRLASLRDLRSTGEGTAAGSPCSRRTASTAPRRGRSARRSCTSRASSSARAAA